MIKKAVIIVLVLALVTMLFFLFPISIQKTNTILPAKMTKSQEDLIESASLDIGSFEYKCDNTYTNAKFWIETYLDGELVDENLCGMQMKTDSTTPFKGKSLITSNLKNILPVRYELNNNGAVSTGEATVPDDSFKTALQFSISIDKAASIEYDKEIILFANIFSRNSNISPEEMSSDILDNEESLLKFDCVHLVKCVFSK